MEPGFHTSSKSRLRKSKTETKEKIKISIESATYLNGYKILLDFSNKQQRIVNFLPLFSALSGHYARYAILSNFKKFIVKAGNIYWGKNEDVIFPVNQLYSGELSSVPEEEILYVI